MRPSSYSKSDQVVHVHRANAPSTRRLNRNFSMLALPFVAVTLCNVGNTDNDVDGMARWGLSFLPRPVHGHESMIHDHGSKLNFLQFMIYSIQLSPLFFSFMFIACVGKHAFLFRVWHRLVGTPAPLVTPLS